MIFPEYCYFHQLPVEHSTQRLSWLYQQGVTLPESLNRAVLKRQCEFLTGRLCAKRAMEAAGFSGLADIGIGSFREPLWPDDMIGAITHTSHLAAAVIIPRSQGEGIQGVGIDIEQLMSDSIACELCEQILLPGEKEHSRMFDSFSIYTTLVFSAKEALYKAIFPGIRQVLEFDCAAVSHVDARAVTITLQHDLAAGFPAGRSFQVFYDWLPNQCVRTFALSVNG